MNADTWLGRFREEPLAWPFRAALARLASDAPDVEAIASALDALAGVHFAASSPPSRRRRRGGGIPRDVEAYDRSIVEQGMVPTREACAHDLANALAWAVFPASKAALHRRQLRAVREAHARAESGAWTRTAEGDALAMLDEGGIAVVVPRSFLEEVEDELVRGDDEALGQRTLRGEALGIVFGHGLLEHLGRARDEGWRPMAGLAIALAFDGDPRDTPMGEVDGALAERIADPSCFLTRDGHGIASASASVLGTGR